MPAEEADDDLFYALREWAEPDLPDPDLPDPRADPYEKPASAGRFRRRYGADG